MYKMVMSLFFMLFVACSSNDENEANMGWPASGGVKFEKLSLSTILTRAAAENKMVLVDVFSFS